MSLSNELKAAKARMEAQKKEEGKRQKKKTKRQATVWSFEDEVVALYLYRADATKFLKENYSKKRKVSVRAMSMKISTFESIDRGKTKGEVSPQTQQVFDTYSTIPVEDLLKVVISIHRGEFTR